MRRHWSERYGCSCGFWTYDYAKDARHRHNFPALCRAANPVARKKGVETTKMRASYQTETKQETGGSNEAGTQGGS